MVAQTSTAAAGAAAGQGSKDESGQEPLAYAKLWGKLDDQTFYAYVVTLPTTLGRGSASKKGAKDFIDLGTSKALSREHAKIEWAPVERRYKIMCLGKNGMVVAGKFRAKGGEECLHSRTPIKLGPAHLYFLLPEGDLEHDTTATVAKRKSVGDGAGAKAAGAPNAVEENAAENSAATKRSFDNMVLEAFRSPELSATAGVGGLSGPVVQAWVVKRYPDWNSDDLKVALAAGIEGSLKSNFISRGEGRWMESSISSSAPSAKRPRTDEGAIDAAAGGASATPGVGGSLAGNAPTTDQGAAAAKGGGNSGGGGGGGGEGVNSADGLVQ